MNNRVAKVIIISVMLAGMLMLIFFLRPEGLEHDKKIKVAAVAGYMQPFREIASEFEKQTGVKIEVTFTSAGKIYGQVINGAPYDIVLADEERASRLSDGGLSEAPFIYARGQVVLWTVKKELCGAGHWTDVVKRKDVKKIAMANPEVGIYGRSAQAALQDKGLWNSVEARLILSPDLAQVFQYASTGSVDAGFCNLFQAYSEHGKAGCFYFMKEAPAVIHSACILKGCKERESALLFAAFLVSPVAEKIKSRYGFK